MNKVIYSIKREQTPESCYTPENNSREFQKAHGLLNKRLERGTMLNKTVSKKSGNCSISEIKMIRMEMPKLGSEHAVVHIKQPKPVLRRDENEENHKVNSVIPTPKFDSLISEVRETSRKLKQIRKILQERHESNIETKQQVVQNPHSRGKYPFNLNTVYKNSNEINKECLARENKYADRDIKIIYKNLFIEVQESLQEIPEEDLNKLITKTSVVSDSNDPVTRNELKTIDNHTKNEENSPGHQKVNIVNKNVNKATQKKDLDPFLRSESPPEGKNRKTQPIEPQPNINNIRYELKNMNLVKKKPNLEKNRKLLKFEDKTINRHCKPQRNKSLKHRICQENIPLYHFNNIKAILCGKLRKNISNRFIENYSDGPDKKIFDKETCENFKPIWKIPNK
ncbi:uncharacterized protein [Diabrotica undecimpunctata]|uniref:uncharacterized protein n=1 Tax=Diabrotica undecimpunctata TaxID=50387 RepID=UPI003B63BD75